MNCADKAMKLNYLVVSAILKSWNTVMAIMRIHPKVLAEQTSAGFEDQERLTPREMSVVIACLRKTGIDRVLTKLDVELTLLKQHVQDVQ